MANEKRVGGIDFWRGSVLIAILVDHIPGNLLESLTPRNFGLSDSSEAFVFLSGLSVGSGLSAESAKAWPRRGRARMPSARAQALRPAHRADRGRARHFRVRLLGERRRRPDRGAWPLLRVRLADDGAWPASPLLSHQLGYFNILPLYVVLMLWAPIAVAIAIRGPALAGLASGAIYAASRMFGLHLPNWPEPGGWFFNPFAWQLAFTMGLVCAILWRQRSAARDPGPGLAQRRRRSSFAALVDDHAAGFAPGLRDAASLHLDLAKQDLGLARLAHFAALAYLVAIAPGLPRMAEGRVGRAVQASAATVSQSLPPVRSWSAIGQAALGAALPYTTVGIEHLAGLAYTLAGVAALFAFARWIECRKTSVPARSRRSFVPPRRSRSDRSGADRRNRSRCGVGVARVSSSVPPWRRRSTRTERRSRTWTAARTGTLDILAIGSSSTEGIGASAPAQRLSGATRRRADASTTASPRT